MALPYDQEIKSGSAESVLASLYRKILRDLGISMSRYDTLLMKFVKRIYANKPSIKDQTTIKSNQYKELLKEKITFKVFMKGLSVLNFKKFDIIIRLYHHDGTTTVHERTVIVNDQDIDQNEDSDGE